LEVKDKALASVIGYVRVIAHVQNVEHDRTRTEIEGDIVPNLCARVTPHVIIEQSPAFDFGHADGYLGATLPNTPIIRLNAIASHNGAEIVDMGDMVNFGLGRWCCHSIL